MRRHGREMFDRLTRGVSLDSLECLAYNMAEAYGTCNRIKFEMNAGGLTVSFDPGRGLPEEEVEQGPVYETMNVISSQPPGTPADIEIRPDGAIWIWFKGTPRAMLVLEKMEEEEEYSI